MRGARNRVGPSNAALGARPPRDRRRVGCALVQCGREEHRLRSAGNRSGRASRRRTAPRGPLPPVLRAARAARDQGTGMMDAFSYLSVLLSIILGLAIAQVLQGYRALLLARGRVRLSAPVLIWSGLLLLVATQAWWASFGLRQRMNWDFLSFAIILLQMVLLYMLSAVIFPEVEPSGPVDLVDHFDRHRRAFYSFLLAMLVVS